jgi:hypothetical protein
MWVETLPNVAEYRAACLSFCNNLMRGFRGSCKIEMWQEFGRVHLEFNDEITAKDMSNISLIMIDHPKMLSVCVEHYEPREIFVDFYSPILLETTIRRKRRYRQICMWSLCAIRLGIQRDIRSLIGRIMFEQYVDAEQDRKQDFVDFPRTSKFAGHRSCDDLINAILGTVPDYVRKVRDDPDVIRKFRDPDVIRKMRSEMMEITAEMDAMMNGKT